MPPLPLPQEVPSQHLGLRWGCEQLCKASASPGHTGPSPVVYSRTRLLLLPPLSCTLSVPPFTGSFSSAHRSVISFIIKENRLSLDYMLFHILSHSLLPFIIKLFKGRVYNYHVFSSLPSLLTLPQLHFRPTTLLALLLSMTLCSQINGQPQVSPHWASEVCDTFDRYPLLKACTSLASGHHAPGFPPSSLAIPSQPPLRTVLILLTSNFGEPQG